MANARAPRKFAHVGKRDGASKPPVPQKLSDRIRVLLPASTDPTELDETLQALADEVETLERKCPAWFARRAREIADNNNMDDRAKEQLRRFGDLLAQHAEEPDPDVVRLVEVTERLFAEQSWTTAEEWGQLDEALAPFRSETVVAGGSPADG